MATQTQLRRGTTVQHSSFTGAAGEVTVDTDKNTVVVHDGTTVGGVSLSTEAQVNDRMQVANVQSYVTTQINTVLDGAPAALDTLNELAAALGDDANFATTITSSIGTKASNTYVNAQIGASNTNIRNYANQTFVTKAIALTTNNAVVNLVNDRIQVANAAATYSTLTQLGNTNSYIAGVQSALDTQEAKQASDLANTNSYIAGVQTNVNVQIGSSNTSIRQYINAEIGSSNTSIRNYTDTTYETKAVALTSNNAQNSLILDRLQVSNATSLFVNVSGDTMSGALAMGTNKITGMGNPTAAQDAATKTYVDTAVANVVDSAPEALNTLNELAAALGDDANFATTTATTLGTKAANSYVNATFSTLTQLGNTNSYIATKADTGVTLTAGNGLTGGGDISASRSFAVGAGTGIVVNADDVAVDVGTTANKIVQLNGSAQLPAVDGSLLTGLNAGATVTDKSDDVNYNIIFTNETSGLHELAGIDNGAFTFNPSTGTASATIFNATSDLKLKENIVTIDNALDKINLLRGVNFDWKKNGMKSMGVIAQEVEQVIPEVVSESEGTKSVNYGAMIGLLIQALKEQQEHIDELKQIINNV